MSRDYREHIRECNQDFRYNPQSKPSKPSGKSNKVPRLRSVISVVKPRKINKENSSRAESSSASTSSLIPRRQPGLFKKLLFKYMYFHNNLFSTFTSISETCSYWNPANQSFQGSPRTIDRTRSKPSSQFT